MKKNLVIQLGISVAGYKNKAAALNSLRSKKPNQKMAFEVRWISLEELCKLIKDGHAFCQIPWPEVGTDHWTSNNYGRTLVCCTYKSGVNKDAYKSSFISNDYVNGAQVVFVDVDKTECKSLNEFINKLTLKPTVAYTTYSHTPENCRFRLVYALDRKVNGAQYKHIADFIIKDIYNCFPDEKENNTLDVDNCGRIISQIMYGSNRNASIICSGIVYKVKFFGISPLSDEDFEKLTRECEKNEMKRNISKLENMFSPDIVKAVRSFFSGKLSWEKLNSMYSVKEGLIRNTTVRDCKKFVEFGEGCYQLVTSSSMVLLNNPTKVTDGHKRRKKIYNRMCYRRILFPKVSADILLLNAVYDVHCFFNNDDHVITAEVLMKNVASAMKQSMTDLLKDYAEVVEKMKKEAQKQVFFVKFDRPVNKSEINSYIKTVKGHLNWLKMTKMYKPNLSNKENIKRFKKAGIHCERSTFFDFKKKYKLAM